MRIVPYDPAKHRTQLGEILYAMRGQPYPGPLAGDSVNEMLEWLDAISTEARWVAVNHAGTVLGHVGLCRAGDNATRVGFPAESAEIVRLFVSPEARRKRVGARLLRHASTQAHRQKIDGRFGKQPRPVILLVSDHLESSIAFYEREFWETIGEKRSKFSGDRLLIYSYSYSLRRFSWKTMLGMLAALGLFFATASTIAARPIPPLDYLEERCQYFSGEGRWGDRTETANIPLDDGMRFLFAAGMDGEGVEAVLAGAEEPIVSMLAEVSGRDGQVVFRCVRVGKVALLDVPLPHEYADAPDGSYLELKRP